MAPDHPFNSDVQNCLRLSCLLINVGTDCIRNVFLREVKKKFNKTWDKVIHNANVRSKIQASPFLNKTQYTLLYPSSHKANHDCLQYDITLLCNLICLVCGVQHVKYAQPSDTSLEADIARIRGCRNALYGHLAKIEMNDTKFKKNWHELSATLLRMGAAPKEIDDIQNSTLSPDDLDDYRTNINMLFMADVSDMKALTQIIIEALDTNQELLKDMIQNVDTLKADLQKNLDEFDADILMSRLQMVFQNLVEPINQAFIENMHNLKGGQQVILMELHNVSQQQKLQIEQSQEQITLLEDLQERFQSNSDSLVRLTKNATIHTFRESESMLQIGNLIGRNRESFKIVMLTPAVLKDDESTIQSLCQALASVPWNIIIDLDYESRTVTGLHDRIASHLSKDLHVSTYEDAKRVPDHMQERIANGHAVLWLLANGCKDSNCPPCEDKFGKSKTKISHVLDNIFGKIPAAKPILLLTLILSDKSKCAMNKLIELVMEVADSNEDIIQCNVSNVISIHVHPENSDFISLESKLWNHMASEGSLPQITNLFGKIYSPPTENDYILPGSSGPFSLTRRDMAQADGIVEIYHKNVGQLDFEGKTEDEVDEIMSKIKLNFLKGQELSPEGLYLNDKDQVYVKRKEMEVLKTMIEEELEDRKTWKSSHSLSFLLKHDRSGGGTTSIRYVAYSLRETFPCVIVQIINEKFFEIIKKISKHSRKPLLIVIDRKEYLVREVRALQLRLNYESVKSLVVYVKHEVDFVTSQKDTAIPESEYEEVMDKLTYKIPSDLTSAEDHAAFKNLYDLNKNKTDIKKVFLFGLLRFLQCYEKISEIIDTTIEEVSYQQTKVIQLVCFVWRYAHIPIPSLLVRQLLLTEDTVKSTSELLGSATNLLITQKDSGAVRPAHDCIVNTTLSKMLGDSQVQQLKTFVTLLVELLHVDSTPKEKSTDIMFSVIIQRESFTQAWWTAFIDDLEIHCGCEFVKTTLEELTVLLAHYKTSFKAHVQALLARYLMWVMKEPDRAIEEIRQALGLLQNQSIAQTDVENNIHLHTYGSLLRQRIIQKRYSKVKPLKKEKEVACKQFLKEAECDVEEAISSFQKCQTRKVKSFTTTICHNPASFVGEAKVRALHMKLYFELICNSNHDIFAKYIEATHNRLLKEAEAKAYEALDKLDCLLSLNRIQVEQIDENLKTAWEVKFEFLRLRIDKNASIQKILKTLPLNVPCDIAGIVRRPAFSADLCTPWEDLNREQLELIITTIDQRLPNLERCNYKSLLLAMIYIRQPKYGQKAPRRLNKYNLKLACECASLWAMKDKWDLEAHFIHGVLLLVKGLQEEDLSKGEIVVREALDCFGHCQKMCQSSPISTIKKRRFTIGKEEGLAGLIPVIVRPDEINEEMYIFEGRQCGKHTVVRPFEKILKAKIIGGEEIDTSHQQLLLQFNLVFTYENILAVNCSPVTEFDLMGLTLRDC